jgi:hypothetical protein
VDRCTSTLHVISLAIALKYRLWTRAAAVGYRGDAVSVRNMLIALLPLLATGSVLIPSTWRLLKNPSGRGLSLSTSLSAVLSMTAWLGYSLQQDLVISVLSSSILLVYYVMLLGVCVTRGGVRDSLRPFYVLATLLTTAWVLGRPMAFALVLGLAPVAELPQIRQALRGDAPALSTIAYGLVILRTVPWLPYALAHTDIALGLWVATCTAVNLTMFMVLVMTRSAQSSRNDACVDARVDA